MKLHFGNNIDYLKTIPDNSIDSVVTDPPYGISFMNRKWDYQLPSVETWQEIFRILKHGGHILVACGTRTQHRMVCNIEDAGFEIRDIITWLYGSGFPKSLNVSKAIDTKLGAERLITQEGKTKSAEFSGKFDQASSNKRERRDIPATNEAKQWDGWGTSLKPACEFFTLARKPLSENTVAENVLKYGTGGINIDACRIPHNEVVKTANRQQRSATCNPDTCGFDSTQNNVASANPSGRFPANIILDEQAAQALDEQTGILTSGNVKPEGFIGEYKAQVYGKYANNTINPDTVYGDSGGASRFFYTAKSSRSERNYGLPEGTNNIHPTVKPLKLMEYLVKLITPTGGLVADPFMGSGSTGIAAVLNGFDFIGMELEEHSFKTAETRINFALNEYADNIEKEKNKVVQVGLF